MKKMNLLIWLTQLGYSVAFPLVAFVLLALWLRQKFALGAWVILAGLFLGLICAIEGFRTSLKAMEFMAKDKNEKPEPPPVSFNDHQ